MATRRNVSSYIRNIYIYIYINTHLDGYTSVYYMTLILCIYMHKRACNICICAYNVRYFFFLRKLRNRTNFYCLSSHIGGSGWLIHKYALYECVVVHVKIMGLIVTEKPNPTLPEKQNNSWSKICIGSHYYIGCMIDLYDYIISLVCHSVNYIVTKSKSFLNLKCRLSENKNKKSVDSWHTNYDVLT